MTINVFLAGAATDVPPPYRPPRPPVIDPWAATRHTWVGGDGSRWNLTDVASGVLLARRGIRGLGMAKPIHYRDESPAVYGTRWRGYSLSNRPVHWNIRLWADNGSEEWLARNEAWWRSLHYAETGTWIVEHQNRPPGQRRRYLDLRLEDDGDWTPELDPAFFGWTDYGIDLIADQPLWRGDPIERTFFSEVSANYIPPTKAPPVIIGSSYTMEAATLENVGDEDAPVQWLVVGPSTDATVGVGGRIIDIPFELTAGQGLVIDPRPTAQTAFEAAVSYSQTTKRYEVTSLSDVERTADLGIADWDGQVVAPGAPVNLSLSLTGAGAVQASMTPLYHRGL